MRWNEHDVRVATTAFEAAMWQDGIEVRCSCTHVAVHDPHGLWWLCQNKGWSDRFGDLRGRFYCLACHFKLRRKVRPVSINLTKADTTITLPRPSEREWKHALKRVRT